MITDFLVTIDDLVWGVPLIVLILACGVWLTVRTGLLQVFHLGKALKFMVRNEEDGHGEVTSFGALCTALSATIGTGNIVGVASAIAAGGPGALFWMEVAAFFGMATKYAEGLLAVLYRDVDDKGHVLGGPFYYIEKGMGKGWKWLAKCFAVFGTLAGLLGIGTITQINGITSAAQTFFDPNKSGALFTLGSGDSQVVITVTTVVVGLLVTVCAALVVIGGIQRIAKVSEIIVPFMAIIYVACGVLILVCNVSAIPGALYQIVVGAFKPEAVAGGIVGVTIKAAMQKGVARGIFSNEAGLGSAPIAAAAAQTKEPVRQGLVTMTGTFIDTIIICTMTGLSIVITGAWQPELGLEGAGITIYAFQNALPFPEQVGAFLLMLCLMFFAFTTILGWDYYAERCLEYLSGGKMGPVKVYRWLYIAAVFVGPYLTVKAVWTIADIFNGLMAIPNIIALLALSGVVAKETKSYFDRKAHLL
ncbi:alanine/glycine:cation symporter family protein [Pseudoflavonifractor phocaeensis]|uniref:alanine/glycine:cation symporter family protein n=1 Tax=Pseudoflavonifractor phocaeensis TaxID=1870988 RepID=UPI001F1A77E6|nr:sodium:alanine symporter family protein [Pseudoflavonifractor phocaeensis]MCF2662811.1 sodium:alanine symporter family protein [Pseudoflavonifractor phocaeensis]